MTESEAGQAPKGDIRSQAEAILSGKANASPEKRDALSRDESQHIIHELRVHQIELELQNEELRRAQSELGVMHSRYFNLYDLAPVGYCTLSASGQILEANLHAATLFGISRNLLGGQFLSMFIFKEDQAIYYRYRNQLETSGAAQSYELRMMKKDGTIYWAKITASVVNDSTGTRSYRIVIIDISEQKKAEEEARMSAERLIQVQKLEALGILVAGIAHNLNNVLAAILAAASTYENQNADPATIKAFRMIGAACKRGKDILRSLLQFARPTIKNQEPVNVRTLMREVATLLRNTTMNRIEVLTDFPEEELWVMGDAGNLSQSFMNLGINAIDAMPEGGKLVFRVAASDKNWVKMCVEDSGCGMSPEILSKALVPFFTTKPVGKGTGLGLSMTYGMIKAHQGTLHIDSKPGMGTSVTIRLPRIPVPNQEKPVAASAAPLKPMDVLLVDDDEDVLFLMGDMLVNAGLKVRSADSGEAALEILNSGPLPDLVILDQNMPRMNGIQTMERIRALFPELPILISSGQPYIEEWECFKRPNIAVIGKPFDMAEITATLAQFTR